MIHYHLRCAAAHAFDGWFKDSAAFEQQAERGLVACPECGETVVTRALMAPAIGRAAKEAAVPAPVSEAKAAIVPDKLRGLLQRMRAEIERNSDYVGPAFAEEARKIHRGETERRNIYGESTQEQADALSEEGIEFAQIPWVPRADS